MRKRNFLVTAFVLCFGGCQYGDELFAFSSGRPVSLISATGSLDAYDANKQPLEQFFHVFEEKDGLRLVVRSFFYNSGPLARPYLTVDGEGRAVLHVDTKARFALFSMKCEFLRQFEIRISSAELKGLTSLQVFNHDVEENASPVIQLSDRRYMSELVRQSTEHLAIQDLTDVKGGC